MMIASCSMPSSLLGLPTQAWESLANSVSIRACCSKHSIIPSCFDLDRNVILDNSKRQREFDRHCRLIHIVMLSPSCDSKLSWIDTSSCCQSWWLEEYSIWATNSWKVSRKSGFHLLSVLPKSSFGEHEVVSNRQNRTLSEWRVTHDCAMCDTSL